MKALVGLGMPSYRHHNYGNMYVQFNIEFPPPNWADTATITMLENVLPPRQAPPKVDEANVEETDFTTLEPNEKARLEHNMINGVPDDDDDDEDGGRGGVQCAQQ